MRAVRVNQNTELKDAEDLHRTERNLSRLVKILHRVPAALLPHTCNSSLNLISALTSACVNTYHMFKHKSWREHLSRNKHKRIKQKIIVWGNVNGLIYLYQTAAHMHCVTLWYKCSMWHKNRNTDITVDVARSRIRAYRKGYRYRKHMINLMKSPVAIHFSLQDKSTEAKNSCLFLYSICLFSILQESHTVQW